MSPRPFRLRKVSNPPSISGFKPYGSQYKGTKPESVFLHFEEYEALRLCDYEMLNHHQASIFMDVSRPTLTRIYSKARQKIAKAFVLGSQIIIEGGKIYFDSEWFSCSSCGCFFNNPEKQEKISKCPLCKSTDFVNYLQLHNEPSKSVTRCQNMCICPSCGFEQAHRFGSSHKDKICTECGKELV